eukprot:2099708-Karenia_brevis.AAC.1
MLLCIAQVLNDVTLGDIAEAVLGLGWIQRVGARLPGQQPHEVGFYDILDAQIVDVYVDYLEDLLAKFGRVSDWCVEAGIWYWA